MITLAEGTFSGLAGQEVILFESALKEAEGEAVEIGSLDGYSARHILLISRYKLTAIDPFIPDSVAHNLIGSKDRFWHNVSDWKDRVTLIEDYSWNAAKNWSKPLDFLFIDGDHVHENVRRDFDDWVKFLKVGGLLAMHDSRMHRPNGANFHPGPSAVALERVYNKPEDWDIVGEAFSLTLARKRQ